jgi:hypothetical protein
VPLPPLRREEADTVRTGPAPASRQVVSASAADRALHGGGDDARRVLTSDLRPSPCRDTRRRSYLILAEPRARRLTRRLVAEGPHSPQLWLASRLAGLVGLHSRCIPREVPLWQ